MQRYEVRVYCSYKDRMVDVDIKTKEEHEGTGEIFNVAEKKHSRNCKDRVWGDCIAEGWSWSAK